MDKIKNVPVVPVAYSAGQVLRYDGSNWVNGVLSSANLSNNNDLLKASNMPGACAANQTFQFSSPSGAWSCVTIANLDATVLTSGTISNDRLPAGATYWGAATGGINYDSGAVGVGRDSPQAKLDVAGGIRLGTDSGNCSNLNAGTMKYESTNLYVCNGTSWKVVQLTDPAASVVLISGSGANMNVVGPGNPAFGSSVVFTYQNVGTANTAVISASLSSATNFNISANTCSGQILTPSSSCSVTVTPKATANGSYTANLILNW